MKPEFGTRISALLVVCLFFLAAPARASTITLNLGSLTFDGFITGGSNAFAVENFTGTNFVPDDFPVADAILFKQLTLTLDDGSGLQIINLANLGPGNTSTLTGNPPVALQFATTTTFVSAVLDGQFTASTYVLGGTQSGFLFTPGSTSFSVSLIAAPGDVLVSDAKVISVDGDLQPAPTAVVPEPGTLVLLGTGLAAALRARRKRQEVGVACHADGTAEATNFDQRPFDFTNRP